MSQISGPEFQPHNSSMQSLLSRIGARIMRSYMDFRDGDDVGSITIGDYSSDE